MRASLEKTTGLKTLPAAARQALRKEAIANANKEREGHNAQRALWQNNGLVSGVGSNAHAVEGAVDERERNHEKNSGKNVR